jgi:hypothetical protein
VNIQPEILPARFINKDTTLEKELILIEGEVTEVMIYDTVMEVTTGSVRWSQAVNMARGKKPVELISGEFYNLTQLGVLNFKSEKQADGSSKTRTRAFTSFTTINGYQFAPGFCLGIGVSYTFYDIPVQGMDYGIINNVSFLPVFADFRSHFPSKGTRVYPYIKLNIGKNFLLKEKYLKQEIKEDDYTNTYIFIVRKGGVMVSPGFGFRVMVNKLIQVTLEAEYSYEQSSMQTIHYETLETFSNTEDKLKLNFFKIKLGIGFQY